MREFLGTILPCEKTHGTQHHCIIVQSLVSLRLFDGLEHDLAATSAVQKRNHVISAGAVPILRIQEEGSFILQVHTRTFISLGGMTSGFKMHLR